MEKIGWLQFLFEDPLDAVEVGAGHDDVQIVVPWDETLVTDGSQKRAVEEKVAQAVFLASPVKDFKHVEHALPEFLSVFVNEEVAPGFRFEKMFA